MPNLKEKVLNCFKAAALATGAEMKFEWVSMAVSRCFCLSILTTGAD